MPHRTRTGLALATVTALALAAAPAATTAASAASRAGAPAVRLPSLSAATAPSLRTPAATTVDDRALVRSPGGWATVGRLSRSLKAGATLTTRVRTTGGGAVVLQVGPGRGTVEVRVGGALRATVRTAAARVSTRTVPFGGSGVVQLRVTAQGRGVYVDAVRLGGGSSGGGGSSAPWSTGPLRQLDVNQSGQGSNGQDTEQTALSPGGYWVAFWSNATNLFPGVTDGNYHVYVSDVASGRVVAVADVSQTNELSNDNVDDPARFVAWGPIQKGEKDSHFLMFGGYATNLAPLSGQRGPIAFVKNVSDDSVVALPLNEVFEAAWSPDGTKIAFTTRASYGSDKNGDTDIWYYDLTVPEGGNDLFPVSADAQGTFAPCCDASYSDRPVWSRDGTKVLFVSRSGSLVPGDTNQVSDAFVKDIRTGAIQRVSTSSSGGQANGETLRATWSPDDRYVAFDSKADNLTTDDDNAVRDVFVKELATGRTTLVSRNYAGRSTIFENYVPKWSPDGTRIAFMSKAPDVTSIPDGNTGSDVYVVDLRTGRNQLVSVTANGRIGNSESTLWPLFGGNSVSWTPDSKALVFLSSATNFNDADGNAFRKSVFIKRL